MQTMNFLALSRYSSESELDIKHHKLINERFDLKNLNQCIVVKIWPITIN